MADSPGLHDLNLDALRNYCAEQSDRFFHRQEHDPRYCYEIFRRAFLEQDQRAWEIIYRQYKPLVCGWVERHALFSALGEERDYFVNRSFEKMWLAITPQKFVHFFELKSILRYLQVCVHSVLVDAMRAHEQAELYEEPSLQSAGRRLSANLLSIEDQVTRKVQARQLWDLLAGRCKNEQEHLVLYGSFVLALKPSELFAAHPGVFQDVNEIYRVKENLIARLKRDVEFMDFLEMIQ